MNTSELREVLISLNKGSCPTKVNLHCHTTCSDGSMTPIELIKQAINIQLNHIAITDHNTVSSFREIYNWVNSHEDKSILPKIWTGIEISSLLKGCLVHLIGLGINISAPSLIPYITGESTKGSYLRSETVVKAIKEAGGISILAHPARYRLTYKELIREAKLVGIDGIEVWYDYQFSQKWTPTEYICESIFNEAEKYGLLKTCGTDTHGLSLLGR